MCNLRLFLGLTDFDGINEGAIIEIRRANAPAKLFPGESSPSTLKQYKKIRK